MKDDNSYVKQWMHKLSSESYFGRFISDAGWRLLQQQLTDETYNLLIKELGDKLSEKQTEINTEIDAQISNLENQKINK